MSNKKWPHVTFIMLILIGALTYFTFSSVSLSLTQLQLDKVTAQEKNRFFASDGRELAPQFLNQWAPYKIEAGEVPPFLLAAILASEDKNFDRHIGIDFTAKLRAFLTNIKSLSLRQGGSTITEQVVRIALNNPSRTLWNRWLQIWQAIYLETQFEKGEILSFYLSQVPFASHRRGLIQGASLYFDRSISTLSKREMLELALMIQAPSAFDIRKAKNLNKKVIRLAKKLDIDANELINSSKGYHQRSKLLESFYFLNALKEKEQIHEIKIHTTLNSSLQLKAQNLIDEQLDRLKSKGANNAALMVVNLTTGHILALSGDKNGREMFGLNPALIPRQPGSTLKPFLYAQLFDDGHVPSEIVEDAPIESVFSGGIHKVKNYSRSYYGPLSLREALGNSLNTPAIRVLRTIGLLPFSERLQSIGLSLPRDPYYYGEGIAIGNAPVSLYEMMGAYTCIANRGECLELSFTQNNVKRITKRSYQLESADLVRDILSDPKAREREFGHYQFSHQVALKTGTSTDFRDSWAFAFNDKYLVGAWVGNLNADSMEHVTGSEGAFKLVRSMIESPILAQYSEKFKMSENLERRQLQAFEDWYPRSLIHPRTHLESDKKFNLRIEPDLETVHLALDPRIPAESQAFTFKVNHSDSHNPVQWFEDGKLIGQGDSILWKLRKGQFELRASTPNSVFSDTLEIVVHGDLSKKITGITPSNTNSVKNGP